MGAYLLVLGAMMVAMGITGISISPRAPTVARRVRSIGLGLMLGGIVVCVVEAVTR